MTRFGSKREAVAILGGSPHTLKDWRDKGKLIENIHWFRLNPRSVKYNLPLLEDFIANQSDPAAHQRAIDNYLASLPSNQTKRGPGRPRKEVAAK